MAGEGLAGRQRGTTNRGLCVSRTVRKSGLTEGDRAVVPSIASEGYRW